MYKPSVYAYKTVAYPPGDWDPRVKMPLFLSEHLDVSDDLSVRVNSEFNIGIGRMGCGIPVASAQIVASLGQVTTHVPDALLMDFYL
jgi:hypothetical protein